MSFYVLMRILESSPRRYDRGIYLLTLGRLGKVYERLISNVEEGFKVLDIGCGTGALTVRAARRGAQVKGIDINPQMLDLARKRIEEEGLKERVELEEMGVGELDREDEESYDVVMSGLCLSELEEGELEYTLKEVERILKPGGLLLVADETTPENPLKRLFVGILKVPLKALVYLFTQTTTRPLKDLPGRLKRHSFEVVSLRRSPMGDFIEVVARKPGSG